MHELPLVLLVRKSAQQQLPQGLNTITFTNSSCVSLLFLILNTHYQNSGPANA
jgi:hypothetical protein